MLRIGFLSKGKTFREDKEALPYGAGERTFLPSGFPLRNLFPFTYLLPPPAQSPVQTAKYCKTMLDRARIYTTSDLPTSVRDFLSVS